MAGIEKFKDTQIKNLKPRLKEGKMIDSRYSDGGGLYIRVKSTGGKSWSFMWKRNKLQREIGLGSYPDVGLKAARNKARIAREAVANGNDPRMALNPPREHTFEEVAKACMESRGVYEMNPKTIRKWERTAFELCSHLKNRPVDGITRDDILNVLEPVWKKTPETGRIMRSHLEIIFNYAKGRRWSEVENPALWKGGLETVLKMPDRSNVKHHAAMPYAELPSFIIELRKREAISARALEFIILTGVRTSEGINTTIDEFDLEKAIWNIPASRMKSGRPHSVPLSDRALEIVNTMRETPQSEFIFPSRGGKPLSNIAMLNLLKKRMGFSEYTVHGFRSSFRDWAGNCTSFSREIAEASLAHSIGNSVERSYRRSDALEKRRALMQAWADYCGGEQSGEVVRLHG